MTAAENLFSNLLTVGILALLAVIVYAKATNKTLGEMIADIRDSFGEKTEEVYSNVPMLQDIR